MARQVMTVAEYVKRKLDAAPPLTDEQRRQLSGLLHVEKRKGST